MKFGFPLAAAVLAPAFAAAQTAATPSEPPASANTMPGGRSAADGPLDPTTTSGRPSDMKGTPSMAPSSGNNSPGQPDPGMGRGAK